jgi:uncharacterized protein (TIGR03083 family)
MEEYTMSSGTAGTRDACLLHIEHESTRFVEVAARSPMAAPVPTYPAYTVETLTEHIGVAFQNFSGILSSGTYDASAVVQAPRGVAVVEWLAASVAPLIALLREVPEDKLIPFPFGNTDRPAGSVPLLLAVEVGVHRWDLESVGGDHAAISPELAIVMLDRVFEGFVPRLAAAGVAPIGGSVQLCATDAPVAWALEVDNGRLQAGRLMKQADNAAVVVTAPAETLALLIWKRTPLLPGLDVTGDADVLQRLLAVDYIPNPRTSPAS